MIGSLYCTAVANSWPFIRKSPSPLIASTVRSGYRRLHRHRRRHAIAHEAADRRHLGAEAAEAIEAMNPAGIIARAVAENGVGGQMPAQPDHDLD